MRSALFFGVCWAAAGAATASADDASCGEADDEVCAMRSSLLQLRRREFSSSETGLAGANGTNDTNGTNGTNGTEENASAACLCVFDIDRTLTGKQQQTKMCPGNKVMWGVNDWAYTNHAMSLTLSDAVQHLNQTFCAKCYIGIVSAGTASGSHSEERSILLDLLKNDLPWSKPWADPWNPGSCKDITAPLVTGCPDGHKQEVFQHSGLRGHRLQRPPDLLRYSRRAGLAGALRCYSERDRQYEGRLFLQSARSVNVYEDRRRPVQLWASYHLLQRKSKGYAEAKVRESLGVHLRLDLREVINVIIFMILT
eukprot:TRINITY_DN12694_c0_g1_i2.p1 TRINITY_DN12694_c0_g1~~TRINITY_DN12694_c0_g1_i2.p1  ORF type:complete len:311 (+),score=45.53 TRINITY_DN12694_c0_g1_i2:71-1003(+)